MRRLLILVLITVPLSAEFLHIELAVGGLDCISCAQSVDRVLKRIKGVETASFRIPDATAVLDFKPENTTSLNQIRDAVKGIGYTPKAAKVTVQGQARVDGGKWMLRVPGPDAEMALDVSAVPGIAGDVVVEGSIADVSAPLKVSAIRAK